MKTEKTQEELAAMDLESAQAEIESRVYEAAMLFERLENAGRIRGNGHHMAQRVAEVAASLLTERWIPNTSGERIRAND